MNSPPARQGGEPPFCGVVFGGGNKAISHVPLIRSAINVVVIDVSCRVTVTQTYRNESDESTPTVRYVFPVPSRAAICAFSMVTGEGRLVYAKAKDKVEAMKEFEAAVDGGDAAALQEQVLDDIFRTSLSSIPAGGIVTTKTAFVMNLMNYDFLSNRVQLLLPLALGRRYGALPEQFEDATGNTGLIRLEISVEVQMSGRILSVTSPSHERDLRLERYTTHYGRPSRRRITAKLRSTTYLDRDFELVIGASELERSRCFAEKDPRLSGTIALQLVMIPHFDLPLIPEQEYLFLIDRSRSMRGRRIEVARQSVTLLLRCLPGRNTVFNIFQFSTDHARLWSRSKTYDESNLRQATTYVNGLRTSPGTELGAATRAFLDSRRTSIPTAAFILTDGEVFEDEAEVALKAIRDNMSTSLNARLRLFVLGIGSTVSSDVCEKLAAAGGGECLFAVSQESILSKCTSLLRTGRTSTITDVSVDWTTDISSGIPHRPLIQQSPPESRIPEMSPSTRSLYFAIIPGKTVPRRVVVRGKANGKEVFVHVDVESVKFGRNLSGPLFIHTLAAHQLIRDLEDDVTKGELSEIDQRRRIVKLGEYYQLASSHTCFVAVDNGETHPGHREQQVSSDPSTTVTSLLGAVWRYLSDETSLFQPLITGGPPRKRRADGLPGGWTTAEGIDSGAPSEADTSDGDCDENQDDWTTQDSDCSLSTLSSLESCSSVDTRCPTRRSSSEQRRNYPGPSSQISYAPPPPVSSANDKPEEFSPLPIDLRVTTLVQQMSAAGSFAMTDALGEIIGRGVLEQSRLWGDEELAATALAMVYLEKNLGEYLELWQVLMEKGMEFVKNHPNGEVFDNMLDRAREVV